jgi:ABC-type nitrate/sulfonate/bicarbonate transport system substrate-binding protein
MRPTHRAATTTRRAFLRGAARLGAGLGLLPLAAACMPTAAPAPVAPTVAPPRATANPPPAARALRTVVFATSAGGSAMGLITQVVKRHQLDERYGLNLDLKPLDPSEAERATVMGIVEAGFFVPVSWAKANLEGQNVSFLAPLYTNHGAVLVRADSPYRSLGDLRGKRIATLPSVSGLYTSMQVIVRKLGMDWEHDFDLVAGQAPAVIAALERGDADAAIPFEPNVSRLLATGQYREVLNPNETWQQLTGSPLFMVGLAALQSWIDQHRDTARALRACILDATRYLRENPNVWDEERELLGITNERHLELVKERMAKIYMAEPTPEMVRSIDEIIDISVQVGVIPEKPRKEIFASL